ncbi:MAG: hypothetical protein PHP97_00760 [Candidatus Shapirobacteria bacterium]|nr:hypothetical protein [Candidatus Shapirobacteria bacterium]MDD3002757.1 hypothetical protein [Candidatus Shapirobacteria bacterium]MDD4383483.1 hypothetical protein [Candidatus Shapirobacteria bacterium]
MKKSNLKKQARKKSKLNPLAVAAGAIVGVGVTVAGAVAMSDKKNQKKVKEMADKIKKRF